MAERDITVRHDTTPATRVAENAIRPAVDIFETDENLTLVADMPGVDKDHLDINLEKGILTLKGTIEPAERGESLFREFSLAGYYRQFQLPSEYDAEKTTAEFNSGVLTLTLPKSEAAKPRRIEIRH